MDDRTLLERAAKAAGIKKSFDGCRLCGKEIHDLRGAYLTRVNEKGVPGVWECRPVCGADLPEETLLMMAIGGCDDESFN